MYIYIYVRMRSAVPPCPRPQSFLLPGIEGELSAPTTWPAHMSNLPLSLSRHEDACVYIYILTYICTYVHIYIYVYISVGIYIYMWCVRAYLLISMCVRVCTRTQSRAGSPAWTDLSLRAPCSVEPNFVSWRLGPGFSTPVLHD